jgi:hypothetical protein
MTEQQQSVLRKAAHDLGEHFDTIQIFVTTHQPAELGGTMHGSLGVGNWYARYGQIREWLIRTDEDAKCSVRHERAREENDGEED